MKYISQDARFSCFRRYRYSLTRNWDGGKGKGRVLFIGLNPSTAGRRKDDPTILRCVGFAQDWGYDSMEMVNLFAYRTKSPECLKEAAKPVGAANDREITRAHKQADLTVVCWGNDGSFLNRDKIVGKKLHGGMHCIQLTQSRQPAHPLYLKACLEPQPFTFNE